ncbi:MAG: acyltransferase [Gammaproteobacteria bacterium]
MNAPLRQTLGELPAFHSEENAPAGAIDRESPGWRDRPEAGTVFGIRILERIAVLLGRRALHLALLPVTLYFLAVRGAERRASRAFLARISGRPASIGQVFEHFLTFARMSADRFFFLTDRDGSVPVRYHGLDALRRLIDEGRGGIFLGSHIGSFEAARTIGAREPALVMRIVLDRAVNSKLMGRLAAANPAFAESVIDPEQPAASFGLKVAEALGSGRWVGFLADRYRPGDRTVHCDFLGSRAKFPLGPFLIAAAFRTPVVCLFPLCVNGRYEVHFEIMSEAFTVPREDRNARLGGQVQAYADRLAAHVRRAPCNWFNFYDFWAD